MVQVAIIVIKSKSEYRIPNSERNPKSEARSQRRSVGTSGSPAKASTTGSAGRMGGNTSDFGIRISFGFRHSEFGFHDAKPKDFQRISIMNCLALPARVGFERLFQSDFRPHEEINLLSDCRVDRVVSARYRRDFGLRSRPGSGCPTCRARFEQTSFSRGNTGYLSFGARPAHRTDRRRTVRRR